MTHLMIHGQKLLIFEDKVPMAIIEFFTRATQFNAITVNVTTSFVLFILCAELNSVYCVFCVHHLFFMYSKAKNQCFVDENKK